MTGTITVGLDGTEESAGAADWAAREADRTGMALRLVHAHLWQPLDAPVAPDAGTQQRQARKLLADEEARLTALVPGLSVDSELLAEDPVPALVAEAARAEMLVLGSRGHGALVGYLLGSVSLHVLRQAERPVVVVHGRAPAGSAAAGSGEVLVGVQESDESGSAVLEFAFRAAAARGATVRAVRAWTLPPPFTWTPGALSAVDEAGGLESLHKKLLADAVRPVRERYPQVDVVEHTEIGAAAEVLLTNGADAGLVVVGRRARDGGLRRIGAVAHAVLHHAAAPVAVVPHV
ncbi:universal stress protein [Streptomyces sp. NPDC018031]|uniref:universal stress protein n=1 Tax=Streptomyces sp. NPDC018031 TaxID=3365033 RepID=UPI0037AB0408